MNKRQRDEYLLPFDAKIYRNLFGRPELPKNGKVKMLPITSQEQIDRVLLERDLRCIFAVVEGAYDPYQEYR